MATLPLEGGCACQRVRYRITELPFVVHCCHCRLCQRQTGSAFVVNALVEADRIELDGPTPRRHDLPTDSGRPHGIHRCTTCGTALWSEYSGVSAVWFMRATTLDDPTVVVPDVHIYVKSRLPWVVLPPGARSFPEFYDPRVDLPQAARDRWREATRKEPRR
jgi:hypothetical protein